MPRFSTNGYHTVHPGTGEEFAPLPDERAWNEHFARQRNLTDTDTDTNTDTNTDTEAPRRGRAGIDLHPPKTGGGGCASVAASERQTGDDLLDVVMTAIAMRPPPAVAAKVPAKYRLLVHICAVLQEMNGDKPFYLDCRRANKRLGVSHVTAWNWLNDLCRFGILQPGPKGDEKHSNRYWFVGRKGE